MAAAGIFQDVKDHGNQGKTYQYCHKPYRVVTPGPFGTLRYKHLDIIHSLNPEKQPGKYHQQVGDNVGGEKTQHIGDAIKRPVFGNYLFSPGHEFMHSQVNSMQYPPDDECPAGSMPEATQDHGYHKVQVSSLYASSIPTQGNI